MIQVIVKDLIIFEALLNFLPATFLLTADC